MEILRKLKPFYSFFSKGHPRTLRAKKNIVISFFLKGSSILIGFLLVPLIINYIDKTRYGIWLTLSSFLFWFNFFEIGLGIGLKNKLAEALAENNITLAKEYISSAYAFISIIIFLVASFFFVFLPFLSWTKILNTPDAMQKELFYLALIVFGAFFLRFILKLISQVLQADQRTGVANSIFPIGNFLSLILILILITFTEGNLIYLGCALSCSPLVVLIIFTCYFFKNDYHKIKPSIKYINFKRGASLFSLGVKFFFIQISGIILYQTSNIIITQLMGPEHVTVYNVALKYFGMSAMVFNIITVPLWPAFTEAWVKNDIIWIEKTMRNLKTQWLFIFIFSLISLMAYKPLIRLWVGSSIQVSFWLSILFTIYFLMKSYIAMFLMFINGIGAVKIQLYLSLIGSVLFIPLSIFLVNIVGLGLEGVVVASIVSLSWGVILTPIQYNRIVSGNASGIWIG